MYRQLYFVIFLFCMTSAFSQGKTDKTLEEILQTNNHPALWQVLQNPGKHRVQIIYTQINRNKANKPSFQNYYFHYDPKQYFNPASMVKMPLAFLALEKLNTLNKKGVQKHTTVLFDSSKPWQHPLHFDTTKADRLPTVAHLIKRAFLISENDPYNRLYQFIGQGEANRNLHAKGYTDVRITRQFLGLTPEQNRHTNAVRFLDKEGKLLYHQPPAYNTDSFDFSQTILLGKAHINREGKMVNEPFDFTPHNNLSLESMQQMLQSVLFPAAVSKKQRFGLTNDDYRFLYQYLSQYPSETPDPKYDAATFYDSYVKFFFRDSSRRMPSNVRVFNKVGWSYGFLTDVSYVVDFENKVEYMLAATLYVNEDEILNDGKYEYEAIGHPFLFQLGQTIYNYERSRKRAFKPDLSAFKIVYEKRDPKDVRPSLKDVDN